MNNTAAEVFLISISRDEIRIMNRLFVRFEFIPRNTLIFLDYVFNNFGTMTKEILRFERKVSSSNICKLIFHVALTGLFFLVRFLRDSNNQITKNENDKI